ncbi:uncharacterized protein yc1106_01315 [Curvularia clavata]|uniref:Zn(2)-C6 fungal-type domain-containing protein n=1 Tax=Curvularia clavata TaxID=95742 RepID=A0A9Q8Z176_CURCL|nr:uncharacterized protein yc1106_01315 [Curvularia clavata]
MLRTFDSSTMKEVPNRPSKDSTDNPPQAAPPAYVAHSSSLQPEPPRRRQRRSCDACRRSKRACDAEKSVDFTDQPCSNCLRKNQACTFNWLKPTPDSAQDRERKRIRSSTQSSNGSSEGSSTQHHGYEGPAELQAVASSSHRYEVTDRRKYWASSLMEDDDPEYDSNTTPTDDADNDATERMFSDELVPVRPRQGYRRGSFRSSNSQRPSFSARFGGRRAMNDGSLPLREMFLGQRSSQGFVTNGLLRIYNDSMENALSCWLTEHNCPYTLQKYKPSVLSAGKANREWGSAWGNRMYNRVIQLDRAYNALRVRNLTAEEERTVSKALNMAVVAFASQWAQAGERGAQPPTTGYNYTTDEFPQSNRFERSMQETLWHETSQILHRAAGIDSFRVVFAMIIFSLTQRPLDISRPFPHTTSKLRSKYEYFKNLIQDDDAPIFLELALRQMMAQRRTLERAEQEMPRKPNGEPQDPLRKEDRDTFNLLYWLGVMFDTISAAISERTVVVDDEDCELPQHENQQEEEIQPSTLPDPTAWPIIPDMYMNPFQPSPTGDVGNPLSDIPADTKETKDPEDDKVWGNLFMRDPSSQEEPEATRWPCSYKLAASTLSSAAPVKVLLYRRVAQIQRLVSRKASPSKIEASINAAFQVYNHWSRTYAPFISDCITHHATLPTRIQSWYILLAGHWHLGVFLLSDLLYTIDTVRLSLPNERACRLASHLVATLRRQNALAVADLSLASIHSAKAEDGNDDAGAGGHAKADFHFALNQAALLTEPWTVVFVRSLCRAGYILVQLAGSIDSSVSERSQARTRCADCIEGLWYLGRKSDMAFLAARCLSSMLDETVSETETVGARGESVSEKGEGEDGGASGGEYQGQSPGDVNAAAQFAPATEAGGSSFFEPWSMADIMGDGGDAGPAGPAGAGYHQDGDTQLPLPPNCDALAFEPPLDLDESTVWNFNLQS